MGKFKCDICKEEFRNFFAEIREEKIHCPLCYYKREYRIQQELIDNLKKMCNYRVDNFNEEIKDYKDDNAKENQNIINELREQKSWFEELLNLIKESEL